MYKSLDINATIIIGRQPFLKFYLIVTLVFFNNFIKSKNIAGNRMKPLSYFDDYSFRPSGIIEIEQ